MQHHLGLTVAFVLAAGAAAWAAGGAGQRPQAVPALPGDRGAGPNQTPPDEETLIPLPGPAVTAPAGPGEPGVSPDVVPRSTAPERGYGGDDTGAVNPDQLPPGHPFHHFHNLPDPGTPEDVLPAPDDSGGQFDPLETHLKGGTKPAPKEPEGGEGMPAGGYFKPL